MNRFWNSVRAHAAPLLTLLALGAMFAAAFAGALLMVPPR